MEMTEGIYRPVDPGEVSKPATDKYEEAGTDTIDVLSKTPDSKDNQEGPGPHHSGPWRSTAVFLGLLCVLLLSGIAVLSFKMVETKQLQDSCTEKLRMQSGHDNLIRENLQLQKSYDTLSREKFQLQTHYDNLNSEKSKLQDKINNLNSEKSQLQTSYNNLTKYNTQLQKGYNNLNKQKALLDASYNNVTEEILQLQDKYSNLFKEKSMLQSNWESLRRDNSLLQDRYQNLTGEKFQLQTNCNTLNSEKSQLQTSYNNLNSEKFQLQTRYNNLNSETSKLQDRFNNLNREKSQLQTRYNILNLEKSQLQTGYNDLIRDKSQLQTSYNNLNSEKSKLQDRFNNLNREKSQLQTRYNNLNSDKSQLQTSYNNLTREKAQLQNRLNTVTAERDALQENLSNLQSHDMKRIKSHAVDVTLDPDSAQDHLILSADGKQVRCGDTQQNVPDNPKKFSPVVCVLGKQGFSAGKFYYEVQVKGKTAWDLGVARESITRKGMITLSPGNGYWTIWLRNGNEYKALDSTRVLLSLKEKPQRVGVFVDYEAGLVSFYDADCWYHLYSFTNVKFTEKLYPFFSPYLNDGGKNSSPLIISSVHICPIK